MNDDDDYGEDDGEFDVNLNDRYIALDGDTDAITSNVSNFGSSINRIGQEIRSHLISGNKKRKKRSEERMNE